MFPPPTQKKCSEKVYYDQKKEFNYIVYYLNINCFDQWIDKNGN